MEIDCVKLKKLDVFKKNQQNAVKVRPPQKIGKISAEIIENFLVKLFERYKKLPQQVNGSYDPNDVAPIKIFNFLFSVESVRNAKLISPNRQ